MRYDAVFLGEHPHIVDEKGRLVMPAKFRHHLADGVVVTKGKEACLQVYTMERWVKRMQDIRSQPDTKENRAMARSVLGSAADLKLDKQGRIQLPSGLRLFARIDKDVIVVGVGDLVEIWDAAAWSRYSEQADDLYAELDDEDDHAEAGEEGS